MSYKKPKIEISSNALVDLKAEISRRKLAVPESNYSKIHDPYSYKKIQNKQKKKGSVPVTDVLTSTNDSMSLELEKSKRTLEAKAKLYEALRETALNGKLKPEDSEDHECLVDFERLAREENKSSFKPPASYSPKRSRRSPSYSSSSSSCSDSDDEKFVKYKDLKSNFQKDLDHVTYSHLRQGEIRTHGVGFYSFSKDAEKRDQEMNKLNELHKAAEQAKLKTIEEKSKKDAAMGARLAKLRSRKGLPDISVHTESVISSGNAISDENNDVDIATMLRKMRDEAEERAKEKETREIEEIVKRNSLIKEKPSNKRSTLADFNSKAFNNRDSNYQREWDIGKTHDD